MAAILCRKLSIRSLCERSGHNKPAISWYSLSLRTNQVSLQRQPLHRKMAAQLFAGFRVGLTRVHEPPFPFGLIESRLRNHFTRPLCATRPAWSAVTHSLPLPFAFSAERFESLLLAPCSPSEAFLHLPSHTYTARCRRRRIADSEARNRAHLDAQPASLSNPTMLPATRRHSLLLARFSSSLPRPGAVIVRMATLAMCRRHCAR